MDEADAGDANTLLVLNAALANAKLAIPQNVEAPYIERHPYAVIIAAGNTPLGAGADESYTGRNPIDASTADRFVQISMDYDPRFETSQFPGCDLPRAAGYWRPQETAPTAEQWHAARDRFLAIRDAAKRYNVPRIVSTRFAIKLVQAMRAGETLEGALRDLTAQWSADERRQCGIA
jgi:hypothetical protein